MTDQRLNGVIRAWEAGRPAFTYFAKLDKTAAQGLSDVPYDGVVFEIEHNPYGVTALGDTIQYMLSRKQITESGSVGPRVTPSARVVAGKFHAGARDVERPLGNGYRFPMPMLSHLAGIDDQRRALAGC